MFVYVTNFMLRFCESVGVVHVHKYTCVQGASVRVVLHFELCNGSMLSQKKEVKRIERKMLLCSHNFIND